MENNEMKRIQDIVDDLVKWLKEKSEELENEANND